MGICTSDPLTYLITNYGGDVCKYIVAIKSEEFIDQSAPKFTERIQEQIKTTSASFNQEFDQKQNMIKQNYNHTLEDVKKSNPGSLQSAAKAQNKNQQQLFGLNSIMSKFNDLKAKKDQKIKEQQGGLLKIVEDQKNKLKTEIQNNKPSLPLFESMPICLKQKVLSDGQQKFSSQIKGGQQKIISTFESATNIDNLQANMKKAVGLQEADNLATNAKSTFQKAKKAIAFASNPRSCFG